MKPSSFKYSVVSIRNMFGTSHLAIVDTIANGYVAVIGDGENIDSYYTDSKGLSYFKRLSKESAVGSIGCVNL